MLFSAAFDLALFAQQQVQQVVAPSDPEKWAGPVLTSAMSLAATFFAHLSGRDKIKYDGDRRMEQSELKRLATEVAECKTDRDKMRTEHKVEVDGFKAQIKAFQEQIEELHGRADDNDEERGRPRRRSKPKPPTTTHTPLDPPPSPPTEDRK